MSHEGDDKIVNLNQRLTDVQRVLESLEKSQTAKKHWLDYASPVIAVIATCVIPYAVYSSTQTSSHATTGIAQGTLIRESIPNLLSEDDRKRCYGLVSLRKITYASASSEDRRQVVDLCKLIRDDYELDATMDFQSAEPVIWNGYPHLEEATNSLDHLENTPSDQIAGIREKIVKDLGGCNELICDAFVLRAKVALYRLENASQEVIDRQLEGLHEKARARFLDTEPKKELCDIRSTCVAIQKSLNRFMETAHAICAGKDSEQSWKDRQESMEKCIKDVAKHAPFESEAVRRMRQLATKTRNIVLVQTLRSEIVR